MRLFDVILCIVVLTLGMPVMLTVFFFCILDTGSPLFLQKRVGLHERPFTLLKFRSMAVGTRSLPTHQINSTAITRFGSFLRHTKLDELPQLFNVLIGDMSLVGPRPSLPSQTELIAERKSRNVHLARPGLTGLAQIQGIDMSTPELLAIKDCEMLDSLNLKSYFSYLGRTIVLLFSRIQIDR